MNDNIIGTCSICGGAVTVPAVWMGVVPPTPTCSRCHAVAAQSHGPVIPMQPRTVPTFPALMPPWTITSYMEDPPADLSAWLRDLTQGAP